MLLQMMMTKFCDASVDVASLLQIYLFLFPKVAWARDPTHPFNNVYHRHKITVMFK